MSFSKEKRERLIDELVSEIGTVERLQEVLKQKLGDDRAKSFSDAIDLAHAQMIVTALQELTDTLWNAERWQRLAQNPQVFEREVSNLLARIKRALKAAFGIPRHRRSKTSERNSQIFLRRKENKTFGEIAIQLGITDKIAERGCKRYEEAQEKALRTFATVCVEALEFMQEQSAKDSRTELP